MMKTIASGLVLLFVVSVFAGVVVAQEEHRIEWQILDVDDIPIPVRLSLAGGGLENFQTYDNVQIVWTVLGEEVVIINSIEYDVDFPDFGRYNVSAEYWFSNKLEAEVQATVVINMAAYRDAKAEEGYELFKSSSTVFAIISLFVLAAVMVVGFKRREFFIGIVGIIAFTASIWIAPDAWIALIRLATGM